MNGWGLLAVLMVGAIAVCEIGWELYRHRSSIRRALSGPFEIERNPEITRGHWREVVALAVLVWVLILIGFAVS